MRLQRIVVIMLALALATAVASAQQKLVAGPYSTWDADLINAEGLTQTGAGVYVAVLDTGLAPNWKDYFPPERIATQLGIGFEQNITFNVPNTYGSDFCGYYFYKGPVHTTGFLGSNNSTHGTHVTSTIIGYNYRSNSDAAAGFVLPAIYVRGIAPNATIIPVKVLNDYNVPALPQCGVPQQWATFGTSEMIAAGINYVTGLAKAGYKPIVINMSLGGGALAQVEKDAIDNAIANGVVIVAAAGNEGEAAMGYPGAYPPVISAGAAGWVGEWIYPGAGPDTNRSRMWWLKYGAAPLATGSGDVADPTVPSDVYVTDFSSRAFTDYGQELDVLAPGSWVRGPYPEGDGYSRLPWWSKSIADLRNKTNLNSFYFLSGTSMATPHVASVAALILEKNPNLTAGQVETILRSTALGIPSTGSAYIRSNAVANSDAWGTVTWGTTCEPDPVNYPGVTFNCDPVGAGLVQAGAALAATP